VKEQVSHPYKTTRKIVFLQILFSHPYKTTCKIVFLHILALQFYTGEGKIDFEPNGSTHSLNLTCS
jgi:hypothetical protein